MNLSWLEISFLYLAALSVSLNVCRIGFIYHDADAFGMGLVGVVYCLLRGGKAAVIWWKAERPN